MGSYRNAEDVRAIARRLHNLKGDERAQAVTQATITGLFKVRGPSRVVLAPFHLLPSRKKEAAFLNLFRTSDGRPRRQWPGPGPSVSWRPQRR